MSIKSFRDQLGSTISLSAPPQRIISLVPSQTELLYDLGLEKEVVGITKFCIHPGHWKNAKSLVGGTKNFNINIIESLRPDLIIGNKEENDKLLIERLQQKWPVWMSNVDTLDHAREMIQSLGVIIGKQNEADELINEIDTVFKTIIPKPPRRVVYLIWRKPWMAAGAETFIHAMLQQMGLVNCLSHLSRYPQLTDEQLQSFNPELILLSTEPYPFKEQHIFELSQVVPKAEVMLVDGEMFSWYGSRLRKAPAYFNSLQI